ncbi:MAG: hypothetical protein KC418_02370 [Anaerolineales bacterium]|nr:hypothetical protein [Anaerolineales bacterium]MCB8954787.1 hypothetical protein [Ardenticatenales bacterium]
MSSVSAKASFANATREFAHRLNLFGMGLGTMAGILYLLAGWLGQERGEMGFGLIMTVLGIAALTLYLRYMGSIQFELSDEGFHYREDSRKLDFAWKEIESIKIEPRKKRITLWARGKRHPMVYLGISENESVQLIQFLQGMISHYAIQQR